MEAETGELGPPKSHHWSYINSSILSIPNISSLTTGPTTSLLMLIMNDYHENQHIDIMTIVHDSISGDDGEISLLVYL